MTLFRGSCRDVGDVVEHFLVEYAGMPTSNEAGRYHPDLKTHR